MMKGEMYMHVLLVLNRKGAQNVRVIVRAHTRYLRERIVNLLEEDRDREAFELLYKKAEVETYLNPGERPSKTPLMTLVEDDLS